MTPDQPTATATPNDLAPMSNDELLELYQQISSRVGMYNTEVLIQRMFEIRKKLNRRMGELAEAKAEVARLKADNESLRTLWTEIRTVLIQSRAANCVCSYGAQQADAVEAANAVLKRMPPDVTNERDQLRARVTELEAVIGTARSLAYGAPELNMCNYNHEQVRQLNDAMCEVFTTLDAAIDAAKGTK